MAQMPAPNSLQAFDMAVAASKGAPQPSFMSAIAECSSDLNQVYELRRNIFNR